jgi:hypothetical protein
MYGTPMPTPRGWLAVAVVNDTLYTIGGSPGLMISFIMNNEQYIPFGYGTIPPESQPEPFPTALVIAAVATVAVVGVGFLVYFKKRNH